MKNETLPTADPAGARIAALRQDVRSGNLPTDEELRELWRVAGGGFYVASAERNDCEARMPEEFLLPLLRTMLTQT
jgi:hypothetical protein